MKFLELQLAPFGQFDSLGLDLSGDKTFHFVYGHNEAGKSTTLRAIYGFLYGIPVRTPDQREKGLELRIKARISGAGHGDLSLMRRKGSKGTVLDWSGNPADESLIAQCLGNMDERLFRTMYGLDHSGLVEGGRQLLESGGGLAESLFQAGAGVTHLRKTLTKLETDALSYFSSSKNNKSAGFNEARVRYDLAQRLLNERSTPPKTWIDLDRDHNKALAGVKEIQAELQDLTAQKRRLERLLEALPHFATWTDLQSRLEDLKDAIVLPESASRDREQVELALDRAKSEQARLTSSIETSRERMADIAIADEVLENAGEIESLSLQWGAVQKAGHDIPTVLGEQKQFEDDAHRLYEQTKSDVPIERFGEIMPDETQRNRIRKAISTWNTVNAEQKRLGDEYITTFDKAKQLRDQLDGMPKAPDTTNLTAVLETAEQSAAIDVQIAEALAEAGRLEEVAEFGARQLPLWSGTAAGLQELAVPDSQTIERFDREFRASEAQTNTLNGRLGDLRASLTDANSKISFFLESGEVPTLQDVISAREHRDAGWGMVKAAWKEGSGQDIFVEAFSPDAPLAEAYQQSVLDADRAGDRLRDDAQRAADYMSLQRECSALTERIKEFEDLSADVATRYEKLTVEWESMWPVLDAAPLPPSEMVSWRNRYTAILDLLSAAAKLRSEASALAAHRNGLIEAVSGALLDIGVTIVSGGLLGPCISIGRARVKEAFERASARQQLENKTAELSLILKELGRMTDRGNHAAIGWSNEWETLMAGIGLQTKIRPSECETILERFSALESALSNSSDRRKRVEAMQEDAHVFGEAVRRLVSACAQDLDASDPATIAKLMSRLSEMRERKAQLVVLLKQIQDAQDQLPAIEMDVAKQNTRIAELLAHAGCENLDELKVVEERSASKRELMHNAAQSETIIKQTILISDWNKARAELLDINADAAAGQLTGIDQQISENDERLSVLNREVGSLGFRLQEIKGGDEAAEAALEVQNAIADMRSAAERYVRVRLAANVLKMYMERYREQNQGPVLLKASELFAKLTLGSFKELQTGANEKDESILYGVRPGGAHVPVEGMSDGTRDILYLSLRIASLHNHLKTADPVPFIVDDILINLDDQRAVAAFEALAELSQRTQVIFFSHHDHLRAVAEATIPEEILAVHRLIFCPMALS